MLSRARNTQVRSKLAPLGFIVPSRPTLSKKPPTGELWVHEVKRDGYWLQVRVRSGRVRLYTMNAADSLSRCFEHATMACAFDLLRLDGMDLRRSPLAERKEALRKLLRRAGDGIQYVHHHEDDGEKLFEAACKLGLEGIVSKRLTAPISPARAKAGSRCAIRIRQRTYELSTGRSDG
jgi:bifunctional non-homologous end joining protein LigD